MSEKAIISNRIYFRPSTDKSLKEIMTALTYRIEGKINPRTKIRPVELIRNYRLLPNGVISIPQGRFDLIPEDFEVEDKRVLHSVPFPNTKYDLREAQLPVYNEVNDTCMINAMVGWGKTATALHIAKKLGQKTLVVTHTTALRDQWVEEVEKLYNFTPGIIGSGKYDIEDHFIVIGNVQTVSKFIPQLSKEFGTVVLDECLDYESQIDTLEFGKKKLGVIVNNKLECHVKSIDLNTKKVCYKKVLRYFKNKETNGIKIIHSGGGSIKSTTNHSFFILNKNYEIEKIKAENLQKGNLLIQDRNRHKSTNIINKEWHPFILGMLLGDGSLAYPHNNSDSVRLTITHGEDQSEYLNWKKSILSSAEPTEGSTISGYGTKKVFNISTKSFYDVENWKESIYNGKSGSKIKITKELSDILTRESWLFMYLDDGSNEDNNITFSFCEFDEVSCFNLINSLKKIFGVENPKFYQCKKGFSYIRLNKEDSLSFKNQISSLVHPSMYYKLKGINTSNIEFNFPIPNMPIFNSEYCVRKITNIYPCTLTGGNRYNIEVEDTHTYFANGILVSNCHHVPASTFANIIDGMYARYRIGLSGTMNRTDGKHILFKDYFGSIIHRPPQSDTLAPTIKLVPTGVHLTYGAHWAKKINDLLYDEDYQKFVASLAITQINLGHSVLIPADRVEFLNKVKEYIGSDCLLITGETPFEERKQGFAQIDKGEKMCIAGSRQIFSEGLSVNRLSCIILAVPTSNPIILEQIIGRAMRQHPNKLNPVIYDLQFSSPAERKQNNARLAFYVSKGWNVSKV